MQEFMSPDEIAEQLKISPKTVRAWLRSGELIGVKVGKSWRIHQEDLARLFSEQLFKARLDRANKMHPEHEWIRGFCRECGALMPEPAKSNHWVCGQACRLSYDAKAAAVVERGTPEFSECASTVVPPY